MSYCLLMGRHMVPFLFVAAGLGSVAAAPVQVDPAFGYRIGDKIVAVARVAIDERAKLDPDSLPKIGRINGWLSLDEVRVEAESGGLEVTRIFQVTASAPEPRLLFLPKAQLKFTLGQRELSEQLESVPISVSPLTSSEPILRNGFGALRPDRDVPEPQAEEALRKAWVLGAVLAALALAWSAVRGVAMRRRGFAPFAVAARRLRRLRSSRGDPEVVRQAYRILHEAFNEAAGEAVFASKKEGFIARHPRFAAEARTVRAFFDRSENAFFNLAPAQAPADSADGQRAGAEVAWLTDAAKRLARIERPGG
ncbi:MAG TPA: hypothetical protein VEY69_03895 [Lautropia sp.]|nr:hypothetical protein [Lautropia sp.]